MIKNYQTILVEKKRLTPDQLLLKFLLIEPREIVFQAGQYLILKINNQSRLYSIFSSPRSKNSFELMVKLLPGGLGSDYLNNLKINDRVNFQGPAGNFTLRENKKDKIFLATYTGLAPLWSMINDYYENNLNSTLNLYLYWGLRTFEDTCLLNALKEICQRQNGFQFFLCFSQEKSLMEIPEENRKYFRLGRITDTLEPIDNRFDYYICGSRQVVTGLNQFLLEKGIDPKNIYFEKF
jgi:NAD(P)H-flavin reductase